MFCWRYCGLLSNAIYCSRTRRKEPRLATFLWSRRIHEAGSVIPSQYTTPTHHVSDLEDEIEKLEASAELSAPDKSRLTNLKNELSTVMKKKDEYVKEHPEQRKLVYRPRKQERGEDQKDAPPVEQKRNLFNKHGLPRHPERSIYYDPVMNPYGVPPPGMPYIERRECVIRIYLVHVVYIFSALTADEVNNGEDVGGGIFTPMLYFVLVLIHSKTRMRILSCLRAHRPVLVWKTPRAAVIMTSSCQKDLHRVMYQVRLVPWTCYRMVLITSRTDQNIDQAPPSAVPPPFPPPPPHIPPGTPSFILPPPPPGLNGAVYTSLPGAILRPLPPPGFFPRRIQSAAAIQDPLSSIPHQTYQAHRASQLPPGHPSLPPKPPIGVPGAIFASAAHNGAIISAEPELRDFKKEATAFVPASLKRKRVSGASSSVKVNAAPSVNVDLDATSPQARPDLVGVLKNQFGTATSPLSNSQAPAKGLKAPIVKEKDDYQKFVDEVGDLLGPLGSP